MKQGTASIRGLSLNGLTLMEDKHARTIATANYAKRCYHEDFTNKLMLPHQRNCSKRRRLSFFFWKSVNNDPINSLSINAFSKMQNLKFLNLSYVKLNGSYKDFPRSLVWLCCNGFSLNSIPDGLYVEKLIVLKMQSSNLKYVWKGIKE